MDATILVYEEIGPKGLLASDVEHALRSVRANDEVRVRINSPGGNVLEGLEIYELLRSCPAKVIGHVDGEAASIASIVLLACDHRVIAKGGSVFVHAPHWGRAAGPARRLREASDELRRIYVERTNGTNDEWRGWMTDKGERFGWRSALWYGLAHETQIGVWDYSRRQPYAPERRSVGHRERLRHIAATAELEVAMRRAARKLPAHEETR